MRWLRTRPSPPMPPPRWCREGGAGVGVLSRRGALSWPAGHGGRETPRFMSSCVATVGNEAMSTRCCARADERAPGGLGAPRVIANAARARDKTRVRVATAATSMLQSTQHSHKKPTTEPTRQDTEHDTAVGTDNRTRVR